METRFFSRFILFCATLILNSAALEKYNVLFLAVDDLRPELEPYIDITSSPPLFAGMHTPNINALAAKSLVLKRAFVQEPVCAPSRASILTGRRPDTTCVHGFGTDFRVKGGNFTTIPQFFKEHGYQTVGFGKVFHDGDEAFYDDPISWSEPFWRAKKYKHDLVPLSWKSIPDEQLEEHPLIDIQVADRAVETIKRLAPEAKHGDHPFFIAAGFYKPHLGFMCPDSAMKLYSEDVSLPSNLYAPLNMPPVAWNDYGYLRKREDIQALNITGDFNTTLPHSKILELRRGYYACVTYVDSQIGRVLDELEKHDAVNNTIIVFWSDHGFHLGENGEWAKFTAFELSNWAPFMIHIPGVTDKQIDSYQLVEMIDIFPTLVEAAGYAPPAICPGISRYVKYCVEGISVLPLITSPNVAIRTAAFSQVARSGAMGYSIRTDRYRYTEWISYKHTLCHADGDEVKATELYDHNTDPFENINIANEVYMQDTVKTLSRQLRLGWRNAII